MEATAPRSPGTCPVGVPPLGPPQRAQTAYSVSQSSRRLAGAHAIPPGCLAPLSEGPSLFVINSVRANNALQQCPVVVSPNTALPQCPSCSTGAARAPSTWRLKIRQGDAWPSSAFPSARASELRRSRGSWRISVCAGVTQTSSSLRHAALRVCVIVILNHTRCSDAARHPIAAVNGRLPRICRR